MNDSNFEIRTKHDTMKEIDERGGSECPGQAEVPAQPDRLLASPRKEEVRGPLRGEPKQGLEDVMSEKELGIIVMDWGWKLWNLSFSEYTELPDREVAIRAGRFVNLARERCCVGCPKNPGPWEDRTSVRDMDGRECPQCHRARIPRFYNLYDALHAMEVTFGVETYLALKAKYCVEEVDVAEFARRRSTDERRKQERARLTSIRPMVVKALRELALLRAADNQKAWDAAEFRSEEEIAERFGVGLEFLQANWRVLLQRDAARCRQGPAASPVLKACAIGDDVLDALGVEQEPFDLEDL